MGEWVYHKRSETWRWAGKTGNDVSKRISEQIRAARAEVQQVTNMTADMLQQVDWVQLLINAAKTVGVILLVVGIGGLVVSPGVRKPSLVAFY